MDALRTLETTLSQLLTVEDARITETLSAAIGALRTNDTLARAAKATDNVPTSLGKRHRDDHTASLGNQGARSTPTPIAAPAFAKWTNRVTALCSSDVVDARLAGISLVALSVEQCPWLAQANCAAWSSAGLTTLNKPLSLPARNSVISVLGRLYRATLSYPDTIRATTAPHLARFLSLIISLANSEFRLVPRVLEQIKTLIHCFPGICKPMNTAIFELCARNLSSSDRRTREAAAATMASTVLLSGRANIADSWREMLDWAIGSCHGEIAALCSVINEDAVYPAFVGQSILLPQTLASQNDDYFVDFGLRIRRLQASLAVTFQIIRLPTDCAVRVPFASILGVITRILSVSPASTPKSAGSKFEAAFLIPAMSTLYADCGKLVGAIACLGDSLSQHASLIRQIVARMVGYSEFKPELRISAYDAASILIRSLPGMMLPLSETLLLATHHDLSGVLAACSSESDEQTDIATGEPHGRKRGTAVVEPKLQLRPNIIPLATSALGLVYSLLVFLGPTLQSVSRKDIDSLLVKLLESSKLPAAVSTVVGKCLSVSAVSHGTRITEAATLLRGTDAFTVDPLVRNRLPPLRRLEEHSEYYQPPERPLQANEPVSDRQGIASSSSEKPAEDRISVSKKVDDIHLRLVDAAHAVSQETVTISPSVAPSQTVGAPIPELAATRLVLTDEVADNNVPLRPTEPQDLPKSVPAYLPVEEKPRTAPDISSPSEADVSKAEAAAKSWVVPVDDSDSDELPEIVLDEEENGDDEEMEDI